MSELLARVQAGLEWPDWSTWPDRSEPIAIAEPNLRSNPGQDGHTGQHSYAGQDRGPRSPRRTVDQGGPWIDVFADQPDGAGPLRGRGFAIKALVALAGLPTTAASPVRGDVDPETCTAPIVTQLAEAGATPLGTVTMHEFAFGITGVNETFGTAPNPAAPDRVPGGSSSGSASAVAGGSADFAIGTDTGGSVRIPSAFCGIAGFKPAHGTYPADGVYPLSVTLDHVGFHAKTVGEIAEIHAALGMPVAETRLPNRIGVVRADLERADADVATRVEAALSALADAGSELVEVELPDAEAAFVASTAIMFSEASAIHSRDLAERGDRYGADIRARLELGAALSGTEVAAAHRLRYQLIAQVSATLAQVDVVANPTVPIVAPFLAEAADPALAPQIVANTRLANVVGLPAVSLPVATAAAGPPIGLQLLGAKNSAMLGWAAAVEQALSAR